MIEGYFLCPVHGIFIKGDPKAAGFNELRLKYKGQTIVITELDNITIKHTDKCPKCGRPLEPAHYMEKKGSAYPE